MHIDAQMRGFLGVQHQLDRMVKARNTQHRTLRNRHAANQLRLALVLDIRRPAQVGHLEAQRINLAVTLVYVCVRANLEPVECLLQVVGLCHVLMRHPARALCPRP